MASDEERLDGGWVRRDPWSGVVAVRLARAAREQADRPVEGVQDMRSYLDCQVGDVSHREVVGPLLDGHGASGVVVRRGVVLASWGDPGRTEMAFSVTKSVLSLVAGLAVDDGLLRLDERVCRSVDLPQFGDAHGRLITWRHLLDQSSQWEGELWGKPTWVDAQSTREGTEPPGGSPGSGWAYNDVRVNLTALALTVVFRRPLSTVLRERIMEPIGTSSGPGTVTRIPRSRSMTDVSPWWPVAPIGAADCGSAPSTSPGSGNCVCAAANGAPTGWSLPAGSRKCGGPAGSNPTTGCRGGSTTTAPSGRRHRRPAAVPGATAAPTCYGSTPHEIW